MDHGYNQKEVKGARVAKADIERADPDARIAEMLTRHREMQGLTRKQLADQSGVSLWTVHKIEAGQRGIGTLSLGRLGKVLGTKFEHEMLGILAEV